MSKATLVLEEGGAIIVVSPNGTLGGAVFDTDSDTDGAMLGYAISQALDNPKWRKQFANGARRKLTEVAIDRK